MLYSISLLYIEVYVDYTVRLKGQPTTVTIVHVYTPTTEADLDELEQFYNKIQNDDWSHAIFITSARLSHGP